MSSTNHPTLPQVSAQLLNGLVFTLPRMMEHV